MATTRRELLRDGWKLGGAILAAAAGWTAYESLRPLGNTTSGGPINLGDPANYPPRARRTCRRGVSSSPTPGP